MRLKRLWIDGFKNLNDFEIDFSDKEGITVLIGNNGSGKSNVLEAISAIFTALYKFSTPQRKPKFEYEIEYNLNNDEYKLELKKYKDEYRYSFLKNGNKILARDIKSAPSSYLPSQIIAIYSGEEMRLWDDYYKYSYNYFMDLVKSNELRTLPAYRLFYIDKDYWNEALLVLLFSELEGNKKFIEEKLKINQVDKIEFYFNKKNIESFPENIIVDFVKKINPDTEKKLSFSLNDFKNLVDGEYEKGLFIKLISATLSDLISDIVITFNTNLTVSSLSEGEKKQILVRIALEVVADENSLILMDEPDANIHVANKVQIKEMLEEYENRENILTTHSPTLMNEFEQHLIYLENGETKGYEKAEILKELSADTMSDAQRQILLNSNTDILIVEGKTDEKYITTALEKLKTRYEEFSELNFNFLYMGGSDPENLRKITDTFAPKVNQTIIAFFDNDGAGFKCIKNAYNYTMEKQDFTREVENGIHICLYPKKDGFTQDTFEIEDYFNIDTIKDFMYDNFRTFQDTKKKFKKNDFANHCVELDVDEFEGFKNLFDLINEIKAS